MVNGLWSASPRPLQAGLVTLLPFAYYSFLVQFCGFGYLDYSEQRFTALTTGTAGCFTNQIRSLVWCISRYAFVFRKKYCAPHFC
jgi:hypothetical protein